MAARGFVVACLLLAASAHGETRYISDKLSVELRRGPSTEYLIIRSLDAGLAVDVLEQTPDGYSRVRVADSQGSEGWVLTRFLSTEKSARERVAAAERASNDARARVAELERRVASLTEELGDTKAELDHTRENQDHVSRELSNIKTASANVVQIQEQNESLRKKVIERERQVEELTAESAALTSRSRQTWFVVGAAVLFGGIVVGLIAPTLRRRRRSDW
jgi:SH3 domain protein